MTEEPITPVLFRVSRAPSRNGSEVTAVFPCEPGTLRSDTMTCYAHIGQHGSCDLGWYYTTRPATRTEYADLLAELTGPPYGYRFRVYVRMQPRFDAIRRAAVRRLRESV